MRRKRRWSATSSPSSPKNAASRPPRARARWPWRSGARWRTGRNSLRVFLTGGTGYIGGAVAQALLKRGHEVAALARAESDDSQLRSHGAFIVAGDLSSLPQLAATLGAYDALVHTAFSGTDPVEQDRIVVDTLSKQKGHFVYTSGVWVLGNGDNLNESTPVNPLPLVAWRPAHEKLALANGGGAVIR